MEPFIGQIMIVGFNFAPRGWATCEGQLLAISANTALFSLLGITYGGDGRTSFGLPDLRGRVPIGQGTGPGLPNYNWGQIGGAPTTTLTISELPPHSHFANAQSTTTIEVGGTASTTTLSGNFIAGTAAAPVGATSGSGNNLNAGSATTTTNVTVQNNGGGEAFNNMQPYLAVYYNIALVGIFPSRS